MSRKAAKKAKARGGAPAVELKKKPGPGEQQVSKSLVAEVLGAQAAKDGSTADQISAR